MASCLKFGIFLGLCFFAESRSGIYRQIKYLVIYWTLGVFVKCFRPKFRACQCQVVDEVLRFPRGLVRHPGICLLPCPLAYSFCTKLFCSLSVSLRLRVIPLAFGVGSTCLSVSAREIAQNDLHSWHFYIHSPDFNGYKSINRKECGEKKK